MQRNRVDLPVPDGPITTTISPLLIVRSKPEKYRRVAKALSQVFYLNHRVYALLSLASAQF